MIDQLFIKSRAAGLVTLYTVFRRKQPLTCFLA